MSEMKQVVVIDDEARICEGFERALTKWGYGVETFSDELAGLERVKQGGFDLVVTDLMMPDRTGVDILREMKTAGVDAPLIVITGYATTENALEALRIGAVEFLPKPFTTAELRCVLERGLRAGEIDVASLPDPPRGALRVRKHSWVRRVDSGETLVGVHPFLLACCGSVASIEPPSVDDELQQGGPCGRLMLDDGGLPARLWAPVAGRVTAVNQGVVDDPSLLSGDPYGKGWLLRVEPDQYEEDIKRLADEAL